MINAAIRRDHDFQSSNQANTTNETIIRATVQGAQGNYSKFWTKQQLSNHKLNTEADTTILSSKTNDND